MQGLNPDQGHHRRQTAEAAGENAALCISRRRSALSLASSLVFVASLYLTSHLTIANGTQGSKRDNIRIQGNSEAIDPKAFNHPTRVDNKWLPMRPGMHWIYEGTAVEDRGRMVPERIEITITDLTKTIGDVPTLVSYDLDYSDGELVEAELAFYAQDDEGTVWLVGEYPEEYQDGRFMKAPAWLHGIEQARAGIIMKAMPKLGEQSYSEGWGPAVDWADRGVVFQMGSRTTVRAGTYENVLVIKETARSEKDAFQLKYYAAGVGNIRTGWGGAGEKTKEVMELVKTERLSPDNFCRHTNESTGA
jgi:hypothetical protein